MFDILARKNIDLLVKLLENSNIEKILHDFSFDLRILNKQFDCRPKNIFDTQLAALFLGKESVGLGSLLEEFFNIQKERKYQRVDWTERPLSDGMLEYAVKDTAYLMKLKEKLVEELKKMKRLEWVQEECIYIENTEWKYQEQTYLTISGVKSMSPKERAIFHVLFDERQRIAKEENKPMFKIFGNKQLIAFAQNPPFDWKKLRGVHPKVKQQSDHLKKIVKEASKREEEMPSKDKNRLSTQEYEWSKELPKCRNKIGEKLGIKGYLIINNDQVKDIVKTHSLDCLRNWQKDIVKNEKLIKKIVN